MKSYCQSLVASPLFNRFIVAVIILAGILVGVETHEPTVEKYHSLLKALDWIVLLIFIAEIVIKMIALAPRPQDFFKDGWNVFDFIIVAVCLIPASGSFGPVPYYSSSSMFMLLLALCSLPKTTRSTLAISPTRCSVSFASSLSRTGLT